MRTMFIPTILLLFCSLTQLTNAVDHSVVDECGSVYTCFAPENCAVDMDNGDSGGKEVEEVTKNSRINHNCPGFFRVHAYTKYWAQVSIVSFGGDTKSIIFLIKNGPTVNKFECVKTDDGKYNGNEQKALKTEKPIVQAEGKLQCTFEIELMTRTNALFEAGSEYKFEMKVNSQMDTIYTLLPSVQFYRCDVSSFQFNNELVAEKKFTKVSFKPDRFYCEKEIFKLEYIPKDETKYVDVKNKITCKNGAYTISNALGPITFDKDASIDLRCAADVKYFCKRAIKAKDNMDSNNEKALEKFDGDPDQQKPGVLKCPATYDYLFVDGKLILDFEFECRNYGGVEYWTVLEKIKEKEETKSKPHRLTPTGPVAYCAKTINCILKYKIRDSQVIKGTLHETNYTPICFQEGILQVDKKKVEGDVQCNPQTGDFHYTIGGTKHIVTPQTKFFCHYEIIKNEAEEKKNKDVMVIAGGVGIAMCIGLVVGAVVAAVLMSKRHIKKMNARHEKEAMELFKTNEMAFKNFGFFDDEREKVEEAEAAKAEEEEEKKAAAKKKKAAKAKAAKAKGEEVDDDDEEEEPKSVECADASASTWNDLIMDFRNTADISHVPNSTEIVPKVPNAQYINTPPELRKASGFEEKKLNSGIKLVNYTKRREILNLTDACSGFEELVRQRKANKQIDKV